MAANPAKGGMPNKLSKKIDINTEGLLLLTNDGGLARILELPATGWLRRYRVRAHGSVDQAALDRLKDGVAIDGIGPRLGIRERDGLAWLGRSCGGAAIRHGPSGEGRGPMLEP